MKIYDLRSDTITCPGREMRKAMYRAEVGDDVYGEDPSVNELQRQGAKITGKRDALFVPSGSMGNLIALYVNGGRGNEVLTHEKSHILHYELNSAASIAGVALVPVKGERGILTPENLAKHLRPDIYYMPRVTMVEIENTHNRESGSCYSLQDLKGVWDFAKKYSLLVHMDGARVFNAALASDLSVRKICSFTDTVTFCLSKGLGAPVGSLLCGSKDFIEEARRVRKLLGGGMRQAGILAAAGLWALEHNVERLEEDHQNARTLAKALIEAPWVQLDLDRVETNIIIFNTAGYRADAVVQALKKRGVLCNTTGDYSIRMVTSLAVTGEEINDVCRIIRELKP
ncbi:MAG: low-specificity L-threonine aldolase [Spirochaetales bacterium]|nr:low-specificity L-threonine aldolase [Spirochaetales bacterium]